MTFADPQKIVRELGLRPGMRIADIGAGSGAYISPLAKLVGEEGRVYAIDVRHDSLRRIVHEAEAEGLEMVETIWGDVDMPQGTHVADGALDMVLLSNTLFQLEQKDTALREIARILKPGGRLAIVEWSEGNGGIGPHTDHLLSKPAVLRLANEAAFTLMREFDAGTHHFGLLLKRE